MPIIKVLLVDDHGPLRIALREGLQATGSVQVLGEASTGKEVITGALELVMVFILMEVRLQDAQAGRKAFSGFVAPLASGASVLVCPLSFTLFRMTTNITVSFARQVF